MNLILLKIKKSFRHIIIMMPFLFVFSQSTFSQNNSERYFNFSAGSTVNYAKYYQDGDHFATVSPFFSNMLSYNYSFYFNDSYGLNLGIGLVQTRFHFTNKNDSQKGILGISDIFIPVNFFYQKNNCSFNFGAGLDHMFLYSLNLYQYQNINGWDAFFKESFRLPAFFLYFNDIIPMSVFINAGFSKQLVTKKDRRLDFTMDLRLNNALIFNNVFFRDAENNKLFKPISIYAGLNYHLKERDKIQAKRGCQLCKKIKNRKRLQFDNVQYGVFASTGMSHINKPEPYISYYTHVEVHGGNFHQFGLERIKNYNDNWGLLLGAQYMYRDGSITETYTVNGDMYHRIGQSQYLLLPVLATYNYKGFSAQVGLDFKTLLLEESSRTLNDSIYIDSYRRTIRDFNLLSFLLIDHVFTAKAGYSFNIAENHKLSLMLHFCTLNFTEKLIYGGRPFIHHLGLGVSYHFTTYPKYSRSRLK